MRLQDVERYMRSADHEVGGFVHRVRARRGCELDALRQQDSRGSASISAVRGVRTVARCQPGTFRFCWSPIHQQEGLMNWEERDYLDVATTVLAILLIAGGLIYVVIR